MAVKRSAVLALLAPVVLSLTAAAFGQGLGTQFPEDFDRDEPPPPPFVDAPRNAEGRVLLGAPEGETGLWVGRGGLSVIGQDEVPFHTWAAGIADYRRSSPLEPHTRCKPSGGPRQWLTPYGAEIVEAPEIERIFIFDIGGPHTYRIIYMDGREHPEDLAPSYYGHSVGRWEGDTLVIDSVGYNERFWLDRGRSPHTEDVHLIERLTRTGLDDMTYQITVDDPNVYSEPWTAELQMSWMPDRELFEYICQDNNYATDIMIGVEDDVDRSRIVP
jgi:hypothetical protein